MAAHQGVAEIFGSQDRPASATGEARLPELLERIGRLKLELESEIDAHSRLLIVASGRSNQGLFRDCSRRQA